MKFLIFVFCIVSASAESLHYSINWPSGLSLGEASLDTTRAREQGAAKGPEKWTFTLDIDASIPGFAVRDHYESTAGPDLCSVQFEKRFVHGAHKTEEHITFDQAKEYGYSRDAGRRQVRYFAVRLRPRRADLSSVRPE